MSSFSWLVHAAPLAVENSAAFMRNRRESKYPRLLWANELVYQAAPADFASKQRVTKVRQVQEWQENREQDINRRQSHDLRARSRQCFHHTRKAQPSSDGGQQHGQKRHDHQLERRPSREQRGQYQAEAQ